MNDSCDVVRHDAPNYGDLKAVEGIDVPPNELVALYSNNALRLAIVEGGRLSKEDWDKFASENFDVLVAHRLFWGLDADEGWLDRSWDEEGGCYPLVCKDQYQYALDSVNSQGSDGLE